MSIILRLKLSNCFQPQLHGDRIEKRRPRGTGSASLPFSKPWQSTTRNRSALRGTALIGPRAVYVLMA